LYEREKKPGEAAVCFHQATAALAALPPAYFAAPFTHYAPPWAFEGLARTLAAAARPQDVEAARRTAVAFFDRVTAAQPEVTEFRRPSAAHRVELARLFLGQRRAADALAEADALARGATGVELFAAVRVCALAAASAGPDVKRVEWLAARAMA